MGPNQTEKILKSKGNLKNKQTKRHSMKWKKIVANDTNDKGLISKIYKQLIQPKTRKQMTQSKNGQKT